MRIVDGFATAADKSVFTPSTARALEFAETTAATIAAEIRKLSAFPEPEPVEDVAVQKAMRELHALAVRGGLSEVGATASNAFDTVARLSAELATARTDRLRIVRAAVMTGKGVVYSVPAPGRHGDVFQKMREAGETDFGPPDAQGFIASDGGFYGRIAAKEIARAAHQLLPRASESDDLFSEDLW